MEVETQITKEDFSRFFKYYYFRKLLTIGKLFWMLFFVLLFGFLLQERGKHFNWGYFWVGFFFMGIIGVSKTSLIPYMRSVKLLSKIKEISAKGRQKYTTTDLGFRVENGKENDYWQWKSIKLADRCNDYIFIMIFGGKLYLIPINCFLSENKASYFLKSIQDGVLTVRGFSKQNIPN